MISTQSRYATSTVVVASDLDGNDCQVIVPSEQQDYVVTYTWYQVSLGDTIDTIAQSAYSDPTQWWKIADANPNIMLWDVLPNGTMLRIPNSGPAYVF